MSALDNLRWKGTSLNLGETQALNESTVSGWSKPMGQGVHAPALFYRAKERKQGIETQNGNHSIVADNTF